MYCPGCGGWLADEAEFCSHCGIQIAKTAPVFDAPLRETSESQEAVSDSLPTFDSPLLRTPEEGAVVSEPFSAFDSSLFETPVAEVTPAESEPPRKKAFGVKGMIAVLASLAIVVGAVFGVQMLFKKHYDPKVVYLKDDRLMFLGDLDGEPIRFASDTYSYRSYYSQFSEDGRYFYYYNTEDMQNGSYMYNENSTLLRVDLKKLEDTQAKNGCIEEIADNVLRFTVVDNENVLYLTDKNALYYFDGQDATKIDKNVQQFYANPDGYIVYSVGERTEENTTCDIKCVKTKKLGDAETLATGVSYLYQVPLEKTVFYTTSDGNNEQLHVIVDYRDDVSLGNFYDFAYRVTEDSVEPLPVMVRNVKVNYGGEKRNLPLYTLCSYEDGELYAIAEDMLKPYAIDGGMIFGKIDVDIESVDMANYGEFSPSTGDYEFHASEYELYLYETDKTVTLMEDAATAYEKSSTYRACADENSLYFVSDGELYYVPFRDGVGEECESLAEDAGIYGMYDGKLYYYDDLSLGNYVSTGNLCVAEKGECEILSTDASIYWLYVYEDGGVLFISDTGGYEGGYEFSFIDKRGNITVIDDNIGNIYRCGDDTFVYTSGTDLYRFSDDERERIDKDVMYFWVYDSMPVQVFYR